MFLYFVATSAKLGIRRVSRWLGIQLAVAASTSGFDSRHPPKEDGRFRRLARLSPGARSLSVPRGSSSSGARPNGSKPYIYVTVSGLSPSAGVIVQLPRRRGEADSSPLWIMVEAFFISVGLWDAISRAQIREWMVDVVWTRFLKATSVVDVSLSYL
jgi:hypothetical protein